MITSFVVLSGEEGEDNDGCKGEPGECQEGGLVKYLRRSCVAPRERC